MMGDNAINQCGIQDSDDFLIAFACFGHCQVQTTEFLRHAYGGANFQSAAGQVIQHADFLHHAGRVVVGQYDSHHAKTKSLCPRAERSNQEVGGRRVRSTKMMLAEKYAFKAKRLIMNP